MVVIFHATSLTDLNKCAIRLSWCDIEVLPLNSGKSEGMFTLCSEAQSRVSEATGDLVWKVRVLQSHAGSPAWFLSITAAVPQRSAEGRSPAECLLRLARHHRTAALLLWDTGCLQLLCVSRTSPALLVTRRCRQSLAGSLTASPELGGFTGALGS